MVWMQQTKTLSTFCLAKIQNRLFWFRMTRSAVWHDLSCQSKSFAGLMCLNFIPMDSTANTTCHANWNLSLNWCVWALSCWFWLQLTTHSWCASRGDNTLTSLHCRVMFACYNLLIEIGLFLVMRSSLTHSSLFQADEDEGSSDWDIESGNGGNSSDDEDGEDKSPIEIIVGIVSFYLLYVNMLDEFYFVPQKVTPINFLSAEISWHQSWSAAAVGGSNWAGVLLGGQRTAIGWR
jgi:hypothetical protein